MTIDELRAKIQEIYEDIPKVYCKGLCFDQCTVIPLSKAELRVITARHGPSNLGQGVLGAHMFGTHHKCTFLTQDNRCSIYEDRPAICRIFGAAKDRNMECVHGCSKDVHFPRARAMLILDRLEGLEP